MTVALQRLLRSPASQVRNVSMPRQGWLPLGGIVMATTPAVTAVGAVVFLRDRLTLRTGIEVGCAVAGVAVVNVFGVTGTSSGDNVLLGSVLVFGAVCGEAAYTLLGKQMSADVGPLAIAALAALVATALFAPFALWQWREFHAGDPTWGQWLGLAWWGIGTMALGSLLWYRGVQRVAGTTASAFTGVCR
jgi:drug/metabolite transporter (DMT)-like permease